MGHWLFSSGQSCRSGVFRAGLGFSWGKEVKGKIQGGDWELREFIYYRMGCQGLTDSGSGVPLWVPALTLPSRVSWFPGRKMRFCTHLRVGNGHKCQGGSCSCGYGSFYPKMETHLYRFAWEERCDGGTKGWAYTCKIQHFFFHFYAQW